MTLISVQSLTKHFEYYEKEQGLKSSFRNLLHRKKMVKTAVEQVSFEIKKGEMVAFLGPNGAGKTTTLKMLSGILHPSEGSASIMGFTPWERKNEFKKAMSIVMGQKSQLWWDLPAIDSFYLLKNIYDLSDENYNNTLNEMVELLDVKHVLNIQVRRLSLGERMKLELIAALLHSPKVLFLDEPTIGLDFISQKNIREFLKKYNRDTQTTIILTSHYMKDIEDLCDRSIIINKGKLIYDGKISEIQSAFQRKKRMKISLSELLAREQFETLGSIKEYNGYDVVLEVENERFKEIAHLVLEQYPVQDLTIEDIPLEEGISLMYQKGEQDK